MSRMINFANAILVKVKMVDGWQGIPAKRKSVKSCAKSANNAIPMPTRGIERCHAGYVLGGYCG